MKAVHVQGFGESQSGVRAEVEEKYRSESNPAISSQWYRLSPLKNSK